MKTFLLTIAACTLILLSSCTKTTKDQESDGTYTDQEIADYQYMMNLSGHGENFIFDHSDERQHRHFMALLKRQGFTKETNPALYQSLEDLRKYHTDLRAKGRLRADKQGGTPTTASFINSPVQNQSIPVEGTGVVTLSVGTGAIEPVQVVSGLGMLDAATATATALSSVGDTAYYTQNSIQLLNGTGPIGSPITNEEYYGGADLKAQVISPYTDSGDGTLAAIMTYYYKMTATSTPVTGQFIASCKDCLNSSSCPSFENIEPIGAKGQKSPITVCVYRMSQGECTYWSNTGATNDIVFPVKGSVSFGPKNIQVQAGTNKVDGGTASIYITNNNSGGGCTMTNGTNFFAAPNTIVTSPNTLTWDFEPADFGTACFQSGENMNFVLSIKVPATDGTQMCAYVSNSTVADTAVFVTYEIGAMNVYYGCLAEGSLVTLSDGSKKEIQNVLIGEKIRSDSNGGTWTVTGNTKGTEPIPSLEIETLDGNKLILTQDHPIVTDQGVAIGKVLKKGMKVFTAKGPSELKEIRYLMYPGNVWNLTLGHVEGEREKLTASNSTFFANDILVGDSRMQKIHTDIHKSKKEHVLAFLHESWHQDYLNYLEKTKQAGN